MRILAVCVIILGLATLVFGILLLPQARLAKQEIANSLTPPVTLDNLKESYSNLDQKVRQMSPTDPQYLTYFAQRTSLGLAKSNLGFAKMVNTAGIVDILIGLGLVLGGLALLRRGQSTA